MSLRKFLLAAIILSTAQTRAQDEPEGLDETPVVFEEIAGERNLTGARNWRAPDFSNQQGAIGWSPTAFDCPKGLEKNFKFWLDIYTQYTTDQGLLHDADNMEIIYEILDFTHISARADISEVKKSILRTKAVKDGKKHIVDMLKKLQSTKDPASLNEEERRVWNLYEKVPGKKKFLEAASKSRLRFQLGQRDRFIQGIFFSGRYIEDFERIFKEAGLPMELTRLPFVESSYNVMARSKVGASGLWQIMRYTGKPYMMINDTVDKRNLPNDAAKLATKLFRYNYNMLEAWPLAITGYNHGPAGVLKLTKLHKSRELGELAYGTSSKKRLGFASRNFYTSFLAALEAERNAPKYFGPVFWSKPLNAMEVITSKQVRWKDVVRWFDGNDQVAQIYNPHISAAARKFAHLIPKKVPLYVYSEKKDLVMNEFSPPPARSPMPRSEDGDLERTDSTEKPNGTHVYTVAKGDTLYTISRDFGVSFQELLTANKMEATGEIKEGQQLVIP